MEAKVFILVFAAVILKAQCQVCSPPIFPGSSNLLGSLPTPDSIQSDAPTECLSPFRQIPSNVRRPILSTNLNIPITDAPELYLPTTTNLRPSETCVQFTGQKNMPRLETVAKLSIDDASCLPRSYPGGSATSFECTRPSGVFGSCSVPNSLKTCLQPTPNIISNCVTSPPTYTVLVDSGVSNTLADSLQLLILNDLIESSLDYVPLRSERISSAQSIATTQPSITSSSAQSIASAQSSNSIVRAETVATSESGALKPSPVTVEPCRKPLPCQCGGLNNLANNQSPIISEAINIDFCRGASNLVPELIRPINVDTSRVLSPNLCKGLGNLGNPGLPTIYSPELLRPMPGCYGIPGCNPKPLSIVEVNQQASPIRPFGGFLPANPLAASLNEISDIINAMGPLVQIADTLTSITNNLQCFSEVTAPVSSSIAVAEAISSPEVGSLAEVQTSSSSAVAVSSVADSSSSTSLATAESSSLASNSVTDCLDSIDSVEISVVAASSSATAESAITSSGSESVAAVSASTATSSVAVTESESNSASEAVSAATSSTIASSYSTRNSYGLELSPKPLTADMASSVPTLFTPGFCVGATGTARPLTYELQIPSSIPAQLSCSLRPVPTCFY